MNIPKSTSYPSYQSTSTHSTTVGFVGDGRLGAMVVESLAREEARDKTPHRECEAKHLKREKERREDALRGASLRRNQAEDREREREEKGKRRGGNGSNMKKWREWRREGSRMMTSLTAGARRSRIFPLSRSLSGSKSAPDAAGRVRATRASGTQEPASPSGSPCRWTDQGRLEIALGPAPKPVLRRGTEDGDEDGRQPTHRIPTVQTSALASCRATSANVNDWYLGDASEQALSTSLACLTMLGRHDARDSLQAAGACQDPRPRGRRFDAEGREIGGGFADVDTRTASSLDFNNVCSAPSISTAPHHIKARPLETDPTPTGRGSSYLSNQAMPCPALPWG
ncbi:hypothetical protein FDECE_15548 [Fusarium decemcellulare]|nr:hypothetical protein FDECE_15548 [Fusarium decemcellulare]